LYVDGTLLTSNSTSLAGTNTEALDYWSPLLIADGLWQGTNTGGTRPYAGSLDEVAVYTTILTPLQVTNHYLAGTSLGNYVQTVTNDQPLLYYRMDAPGFVSPDPNTYPAAVNFGSAPPNGAYQGGVAPGALPGPNIQGLTTNLAAPINGIISCIDAGNDPAFNPTNHQPFSVLLWFKGNPADARAQALMSHGTTNWAMNLDGTTGRIVWNLFNGGNVTSTNILNDGKWHQLAGVYDGTTSSLYADGNLNASATASGAMSGEPNSELFIGGNPDFTSVGVNQRFFAGALSQVALFTNALTAAQILQNYNYLAPPTLTIAISGNQVVLTYVGTLLSATNVTGPYNIVNGASSPYIVPQTSAQTFYRTRNP
jgi:hypothetical protein